MEENSPATSAPQMRFGKIDDLSSRVAAAVDAARKYLFSQQHEDGYWCGELEADTTLESDYISSHTLLGTGRRAHPKGARTRFSSTRTRTADGPSYSGGPSNISASVKSYFGLKLAGYTAGPSGFRAGAREDPRTGRRNRGKYIYQDSISASSGNTTTTRCRRFRPRSCCFRTGSGSTSTRFRRGRAPSWCRCRSATRRSRSRRFPTRWALKSCSSAGATNRDAPALG